MGDGSLTASSNNTLPLPRHSMGSNFGIRKVINVVDDKMLIFDPPDNNTHQVTANRVAYGSNTKRIREHRFVFDRLFDDSATQEEVYSNTTRPLLDSVLDGYNATVFAYGATGCGKTHTITGTQKSPGIIFLTMKELFERIDELKDIKNVELSLSYLEIYNETIRDLLDPNSNKSLVLREDAAKHMSVSNLSTHKPQNVEAVMDMIIAGNYQRTMSPTEANATSSRSHAVLQINVAQKSRTASLSESHTFATLSIIDLAGSERASATKNRGERLLEGANINKSLLALGNCINALCDPRRRNHVPYRDSKLTRLLKFSLGGNCKTVMIVCVSPSSKHYDETLNTLKYADRAKKIKTKVIRNEHNLNRHVGSYLKMINEQKQEIEELRAREGKSVAVALDNLKKVDKKCFMAMDQALENLKTAIFRLQQKNENKRTNVVKVKLLDFQVSQMEAISKSLSKFHFSTGSTGSASLEDAIRQCIDSLIMERDRIQNYLTIADNTKRESDNFGELTTPTHFGNPSSDKAIVENTILHLLRGLEDTRGWDSKHADAFMSQAECIRLQMELDAVHNVMDSYTSPAHLSTLESLSDAFFKLIQLLNGLNQESLQSEQDIKSFEIMRILDQVVNQVRQYFGEISQNPNTSEFVSTKSNTPTAIKPAIPLSNVIETAYTEKNASVRRQSSSPSFFRDTPVSSRLTRRSSLINTHASFEAGQSNIPSLSALSRSGSINNHFGSTGKRGPQSNSTSSSPRLTPSPSLPILSPNASMNRTTLSKRLSLANVGSGFHDPAIPNVGKKTGISIGTGKKHLLFNRSPVKHGRKSIKRVRWDDDREASDIAHQEFNDTDEMQGINISEKEHEEVIEIEEEEEVSDFGDSTTFTSAIEGNSVTNSSGLMPSQLARLGLDNIPKETPTKIGNPTSRKSLLPSTSSLLKTPSSLPRYTRRVSSGGSSSSTRLRRKSSLIFGNVALGGNEPSSTNNGGSFKNKYSGLLSEPLPTSSNTVPSSRTSGSLRSPIVRNFNHSVASPLKKSTIKQVLFNNETASESEASNEHEYDERDDSDENMASLHELSHQTHGPNDNGTLYDNNLDAMHDTSLAFANDSKSTKVNTNTNIFDNTSFVDRSAIDDSRNFDDSYVSLADPSQRTSSFLSANMFDELGKGDYPNTSMMDYEDDNDIQSTRKMEEDMDKRNTEEIVDKSLLLDPMDIDVDEISKPIETTNRLPGFGTNIPSAASVQTSNNGSNTNGKYNTNTSFIKKPATSRPNFGVRAELKRKSSIGLSPQLALNKDIINPDSPYPTHKHVMSARSGMVSSVVSTFESKINYNKNSGIGNSEANVGKVTFHPSKMRYGIPASSIPKMLKKSTLSEEDADDE